MSDERDVIGSITNDNAGSDRPVTAAASEAFAEGVRNSASAFTQVTEGLNAALDPVRAQMVETFRRIGLQPGIGLAVIGTRLGNVMGGGFDMRLTPEQWVDALMSLYLRGHFPIEDMVQPHGHPLRGDQVEYLECSKEIARAALEVLEGQISSDEVAPAMREYLMILAHVVTAGSAAIESQMGEQKIDD